ncbi:helix-turn-helix domain-containing protein [Actinomadura livida]|uniref:Helix-turn-helix transcriptional regulator n=1 Tax=Actinomadura livida TaxID=79909 RepID=A0A7W7IJM9_9ACTN|nr:MULTISPECIES: helix-turn-helix transcriptional regulator [Actinomadura]MBB4778289.1 transcriptional regulator with XRE-family HTH domain [Actinomadura catellatispora]GGU25608.1 transcriptional regulator [Actinomadura livida]
MVRTPLTEEQRDRGRALGQVLRAARGPRSAASVAQEAGISLDTLRKIERGAIAAPAFFTVASLARALDLDLTALARTLHEFDRTIEDAAAS